MKKAHTTTGSGSRGASGLEGVLCLLRERSDPRAVEGMARYGINPKMALGVSIPVLRRIAKQAGKDHALAGGLWKTGIHEARILAGMVEEKEKVTPGQMELWAAAFDSWDICDQCCMNLFEKTPFAYPLAVEWSARREEFIKRAGFVLMARLAVSDRSAPDERFLEFFPLIRRESADPRNYVKKAVNWALRQIGKRNLFLNRKAVQEAEIIRKAGTGPALWVAADALRELGSDAVRSRLEKKKRKLSGGCRK